MIRLTINEKEYSFPDGTLYGEVAEAFREETEDDILLIRENQRFREFRHPALDGARVSFVTLKDAEGKRTYERSLCLLMLCAFRKMETARGTRRDIYVHFSISDGIYCTLTDEAAVTEEMLTALEEGMRDLVRRDLPITKRTVTTEEALALFHREGMLDKEQLFRYRTGAYTNLYALDGYEDYYYGYMAARTGLLRTFALTPCEGGFMLRMPRTTAGDTGRAGAGNGTANPAEGGNTGRAGAGNGTANSAEGGNAGRAGEADGEGTMPPFERRDKLFSVLKESLVWGGKAAILDVGDLNDFVVSGGTQQLILSREARHEMEISRIAAGIAADPEKKIVLIAGPSSSGKTTFSHRLSVQLSVHGLQPHPIPVDNYFVDRDKTPLDENGEYDYETLEAVDVEQFNRDMLDLLAGKTVALPTYNFKTGKREYRGNTLCLGDRGILVIEGIHCLNDRLTYALPEQSRYRIYISALTQLSIDEHNRIPTTDGRILRRIVRDARTRGNSAEDTIAMWHSVRRGEERHIFPYQEKADVMFNSALIYEPAVLKIYAQPLLLGIGSDSPCYTEARRLLKFLEFFVPIAPEYIPPNSLLREFIGGGCFDV